MVPLVFVVAATLFWFAAARLLVCPRDRRRARAAWVGTLLGGLAGWGLFATHGALFVFSLTLSVVAVGMSFRPSRDPRPRRASFRLPELVVRDAP